MQFFKDSLIEISNYLWTFVPICLYFNYSFKQSHKLLVTTYFFN